VTGDQGNSPSAAQSDHWERQIYGRGRQLNRYPYQGVVAAVMRRFADANWVERRSIRILDVGCGAGNTVWFLAREGFSAHGIDGSPTAIDHARKLLAGEGYDADFRVGRLDALPWPTSSFQAVIDRAAVSHNARSIVERAIEEIARVLDRGGLLYSHMFSTADTHVSGGHPLGDGSYNHFRGTPYDEEGTMFFVSPRDIEALFCEYFAIVDLQHVLRRDALGGTVRASWEITATRNNKMSPQPTQPDGG